MSTRFWCVYKDVLIVSTPKSGSRKGRSTLSVTKTQPRKATEVVSQNKPARSEILPFKQAMETVSKEIPSLQAVVISTMPRGSLQIAQPARVPEGILRSYAREFHLEDRPTWQAILENK